MKKQDLELANTIIAKINKLEFYLKTLRDENTVLLVSRPGGLCFNFDNFNDLLNKNFDETYQKHIIEKLKRYVINEIDRLSIELYNL